MSLRCFERHPCYPIYLFYFVKCQKIHFNTIFGGFIIRCTFGYSILYEIRELIEATYRQVTDSLPTLRRLSANKWWMCVVKKLGQQSTNSRPTVGQLLVERRPTVGRLLIVCRFRGVRLQMDRPITGGGSTPTGPPKLPPSLFWKTNREI